MGKRYIAHGIVIVLLTTHATLLVYSAYVHSPTLNEPGHLVAGIAHWRFGRYELYNVNPPLVQMVAALPVMAVSHQEDWSGFYEGTGARPEWKMGTDFIVANKERSFFLFTLARWACIPFSLLGGIISFLWARDLYGKTAGVLACALWCFSPNILAHASLITTDAHATSLSIAASYAFWKWLKNPIWGQALLAGIVLGVAELAKTTLLILFPLWPLLWILYRSLEWPRINAKACLREGGMLLAQIVVALGVLNLGYGCQDSFRELKDYHFVSRLFSGQVTPADITVTNAPSSNLPKPDNRFVDSWLGKIPMPFPSPYIAGIDIQQRDFEIYDLPSYLHGEFRDTGWWYYYIYALAIKVPLATWLILCMAVVLTITMRWSCSGVSISWQDEIVLLAPAVGILVLVSSQTGFNHHMRYVLPVLPFIFVWISKVGCVFEVGHRKLAAIVVIAATWLIGSSLYVYPHSLSYFNELAGGPKHGYEHLLGSNIDWGQDLKYLKWWLQRRPDAKPFYLVYYGCADPSDVNINYSIPLSISNATIIEYLEPGWYGISVNLLAGYPWSVPDGKGGKVFVRHGILDMFRTMQPVTSMGYSIYIYHITLDEVNEVRRELGLPELGTAAATGKAERGRQHG